MEKKIYLCIDLKSFYASVECVERGLDPLTTNLAMYPCHFPIHESFGNQEQMQSIPDSKERGIHHGASSDEAVH